MPGDISGTASIPIINDTIVEGPESFDAVLSPAGDGVIIGTPGQAEVTIIDDGDSKCSRVPYRHQVSWDSNFCDFMSYIHKNYLNFSYIAYSSVIKVKLICHKNINPQNHLSFPNYKNLNPLN